MRRILALLLVTSLFMLPAVVSCIPGGYEGDPPPTAPEEQLPPAADEIDDASDEGGDG